MSDSKADGNGHSEASAPVAATQLKKGARLFQHNEVKTGLNLSQSSRPSTSFGHHLLARVSDTQRESGEPSLPVEPGASTGSIPQQCKSTVSTGVAESSKSGPVKGFFTIDANTAIPSSQDSQEVVYNTSSLRQPVSKYQRYSATVKTPPFTVTGGGSSHHNPKWPKGKKSSQNRYNPTSRERKQDRKRSPSFPSSSSNQERNRRAVADRGFAKIIETSFHFPSGLTSFVFSSHPNYSKEVTDLSSTFRIQVKKVQDIKGDQLTLSLKGHPVGVEKAEKKLNELVKCVQNGISSEVLAPLVRCALVPALVSQEMLNAFKEIEKKNRVEILICRNDSQLPIISEDFTHQFSLTGSDIPKLTNFKDFLVLLQPCSNTKYKWQAENDQGEFQALPDDVEESINECSHSGLPQFSYNGVQYKIDFEAESLLDINTGIIRKLLKHVIPPVWSYHLGKELGFTEFEPHDSETIENFLHYGGADVKLLSVTKGTIDFDNLLLMDLGLKYEAPSMDLKRNPSISALPIYGVKLAIRGLKDDIRLAKYSLREKFEELEKGFISQDIPLPSISEEQQHKMRAQIVNNARQYFIDVSVKDNNDKAIIILTGEQRYVQNVRVLIQKDAIELQQHMLSQDRIHIHSRQYFASTQPSNKYPEEWITQTETCETPKVVKDSHEWNGVLEYMKKTMRDVKVSRIERIQNKPLWDKYALEIAQMSERNGAKGVNEILLFHGTRGTDPRTIIDSVRGIDFRYSNPDKSLLWGKGAYFAVNASYSDGYSYRDSSSSGSKQMFLVRVLTGNSCSYGRRHDPTLTKPPPLQRGGHQLYDTVNGNTNGSDVYVVYDHDRAYPAYLITYRI